MFTWPVLLLRDAVLLDAASALVTHGIYKRYEVNPSEKLSTTFLLLAVTPSFVSTFFFPHFSSPLAGIIASFFIFFAALLSSIVIYRISPLHPLARYPGPFPAKVTKFWGVWKMYSGKNHIYHQKLHQKYGPCVRVGPNELSLVDADSLALLFGADGLPKGCMWDARRNPQGTPSLIAIRDVHEHARRRKTWNRAFSITAVKGYEPILARRALQLVDELEKRSQGGDLGTGSTFPINLTEWLRFFAFDFMGDIVFGGSFETMRDGMDKRGVWQVVEDGMILVGLMQHIPWIAHLLSRLPAATKTIVRLRTFAYDASARRERNGSLTKDVFHHLVDESGFEKERPTDAEVMSDGILAIIAGSDTTAYLLGGLFYHLLLHPADYTRLQREVDDTFPPGYGDPFDGAKLAALPFLNAVINEALRINPPGDILQRGTTAETGPRWLGNFYIPECTAVDVPLYTVFRDPRYFFPAPEQFWPERWLRAQSDPGSDKSGEKTDANKYMGARPEVPFTHNMSAFLPFSCGPANCAGRNLATLELRVVVALLMQRFHMRFADGFDPRAWEAEKGDWFLMKLGRLPVVLTPRVYTSIG